MAKKKVEVRGAGTIIALEKDKPKSKCRRWKLQVSTGKDVRTGKYRLRARNFQGTYTQAKAAMREFIDELENNRARRRSGTTFQECAEDYMRRREEAGESSANTIDTYRRYFKAASLHLGHADVSAITAETLGEMYAAMRKGDTLSGRPASGTYVSELHKTLRLVFRDLVEDGVINENPCDQMDAPRRDTQERHAMRPSAIKRFVSELDLTGEDEFGYFLAVVMGLRRGEVCGLSWRDVDTELKILSIRHSFDQFGNLKEPKTHAGLRSLPLSDTLCRAFDLHREAQREGFSGVMSRDGKRPFRQGEDTPVIVDQYSERMNPNNFAAHWRRDRKSLDAEGLCLHELRHSYLSMLAFEGVHPKVMQELAGHADPRVTMDIYTHVNMDSKREAAAAVEGALGDLFGDAPETPKAPTPLFSLVPLTGGESNAANAPANRQAQTPERFMPDSCLPAQQRPLRVVNGTSDLQV